jgi:hypothetical protein
MNVAAPGWWLLNGSGSIYSGQFSLLCSGVDWLARRSTCQAKELSMSPSNLRSVSPELPHKTTAAADGCAHHPMSQQDAGDCHGHEMHPQKLVQLVGCHDPNAGKHEEAA